MTRPSLSVVIPCYGQRETICAELSALHAFLATIVPSHEILLVIDGNRDGTKEEILRREWFPELHIECFAENRGKGFALRHGLGRAGGELVAFLDAGGDLDVTELRRFLAALTLYEADIVIGSKRHSLSQVVYPPVRRLYSRLYQLLIRFLFRLRVRDTQVGMKLFRRAVLEAVLPRLVVKTFAFDLEMLVVAHHLGFSRIVEAPVHLQHDFRSSISWRSAMQALWDTAAVFYRLRFLHWYDHSHDPGIRPSAESLALRHAVPAEQERMPTAPEHHVGYPAAHRDTYA